MEKSIYINQLSPRDVVQSSFLVKSKNVPVARNGKPYLALHLMDKSGEMEARVWHNVEALAETFGEGDVLAVSGKVHEHQSRVQMIIEHLSTVPTDEVQIDDYIPSAGVNLEERYQELVGIFRGLECEYVRALGLSILEDPEIASRYKRCPAAKTIHHAFRGGLLVHSLNVIKLVEAVYPLYQDISRDILIFGAAFHDFGKIYELYYDREFGYTDAGKLVGHITIGANIIDRKIRLIPDFPEELEIQLKHIVLAHHGRLEYGSPKRPATLEAQILAQLDDLDSKVDSIQSLMRENKSGSSWTSYHRAYDQYYFRPQTYRESDLI